MKWLLNALGIRKRCEHLRVLETMACDAVCRDCGENLGFIQNWRDANKGKVGAHEIPNDPSMVTADKSPAISSPSVPKTR